METHTIKFLLLNKHELAYEVLIRGEEPASTVLKLRNQINKLTAIIPSDDIQESGIDGEADYDGVIISYKELVSRIKSLQEKFEPNLFERTKSLANHIYYRLNRIDKTENIVDSVNRLQKEFNMQYSLLTKLAKYYATSSTSALAEQCNTALTNTGTKNEAPVSCDRNHINELHKLKFNGKSCVHTFIQRVNEFSISRSIPNKKLLTYATEIFTDDALHWYRSIRDGVQSWEELTKLLINDFGKFDYDYRLMSEIRNRTQGDTENIIIYLAIMSELFARLSKPISEAEKLEIILHNIRPCYANVLASHGTTIESIDTLRSLARNYERVQALSAQFREPPKVTTDTLAPDLAFTKTTEYSQYKKYPYQNNYAHKNNSNHHNQPTSSNHWQNRYTSNKPTNQTTRNSYSVPVAAINDKVQSSDGKRYCPRCRNDSHSLSRCNQERFLICFKCGKKDVKYPDCTNCNPTNRLHSKN